MAGEQTRSHVDLLNEHADTLRRSIDVRNGLLEDLVSKGVIVNRHKQQIRNESSHEDMVERLLNVIGDRPSSVFDSFLKSLEKTGHRHVVKLLKPGDGTIDDDERPLTDEEVQLFDECAVELIGELSASDDLLTELVSGGCLHRADRQRISNEAVDDDRARMLLDVLRMRSYDCLRKFVRALEQSNQRHVVAILEEKGVIVRTRIDVESGKSGDADRIQGELLARLDAIRRGEYTADNVDEQTIELNRLMRNLLSVRPGSVLVAVFCANRDTTTKVLQYVDGGQMKADFEAWMTGWMEGNGDVSVTVSIAQRPEQRREVPSVPLELKELILMKAAAFSDLARWRRTKLAIPVGPVYLALASVCREWAIVMLGRHFKRTLRRYFQGLCSPYARKAIKEQTVRTDEGVTGVARLSDRLYVTVYLSDIIRVYDVLSPNYDALEPIQAKDLSSPWDMAACLVNHRLYVTDFATGGIWFVAPSSPLQMEQHGVRRRATSESLLVSDVPREDASELRRCATDIYSSERLRHVMAEELLQGWLVKGVDCPRGISVTGDGNVAVVSWEMTSVNSVLVFHPFTGAMLRRIELPVDVAFPHHAVETLGGNFVLCHGRDSSLHRVCLVSPDGRVLQTFGGTRHRAAVRSTTISASRTVSEDVTDETAATTAVVVSTFEEDLESDFESSSAVWEDVESAEKDLGDFYRTVDTPYAVAVDANGSVFVADYGGRRVLVLDRELRLRRTFLTGELDGIDEPRQVWLDRISGLLYVGQDTGTVDVFQIRPKSKSEEAPPVTFTYSEEEIPRLLS